MKKGTLLSFILVSLLTSANANPMGMNNSFTSLGDIQEHLEDQSSSSNSSLVPKPEPSISPISTEVVSSAPSSVPVKPITTEPLTPQESISSVASSVRPEGINPVIEPEEGVSSVSSLVQQPQAVGEDMTGAVEPHSIIDFVEGKVPIPEDQLPDPAKEALQEVKKAVKFYKHPELFEDLNITDPAQLADPDILAKIQEKVEEAKKLRAQEVIQKILGDQQKRELPVTGDFVQYGPGQYDWVFVTTTGKVYKLVGVDENTGNFKYVPLPGVTGDILDDHTVIFDVQDDTDPVAQQLQNLNKKGFPYAKYGDPSENGFDWVVTTPSGFVAKLEGFDTDEESFVYTPLEGITAQPQGDEVVLLPGS